MGVIHEIDAERKRQINQEGYTQRHDDQHTSGALVFGGAVYACFAGDELSGEHPKERDGVIEYYRKRWPFAPNTFKPADDPRRTLIKAAAMIVAEIEKIDRAREQG